MSTTDTRKWLGQRIENLIQAKGMTKRAVAEKSGMPYSSLNGL